MKYLLRLGISKRDVVAPGFAKTIGGWSLGGGAYEDHIEI
jgi:hypothetical protein